MRGMSICSTNSSTQPTRPRIGREPWMWSRRIWTENSRTLGERSGPVRTSARCAAEIETPLKAAWRLVRQTHDECQRDVQPRDVFVVEMADLSSNSLPPNGDGLIGHNL